MNCEENEYNNCELSEQRYLEQLQSEEDSNDYYQQQEWEDMKTIIQRITDKELNGSIIINNEYQYTNEDMELISNIYGGDLIQLDNLIKNLTKLKRDIINFSSKCD